MRQVIQLQVVERSKNTTRYGVKEKESLVILIFKSNYSILKKKVLRGIVMEKEHIPQIEPESLTIVNQDGILDLLDREQYVGNIMQILNVISDEKGSCTLAINGKWGSGNTFLLDKLEYNLKRYRDQEQYLVFHYNCWQYDYYDEPLIAIVSSMIDGMNSVERILPEKISENLLAAIKTFSGIIFDVVKEGSINFIKEKTGIDVGEIHKRFKSERALINNINVTRNR